MKKLVDPVSENTEQDQETQDRQEMTEAMNDFDFHAIPQTAAKEVHPFDGYPTQKVKIGEYEEVQVKSGKPIKTGKILPLMVYRHALIMLAPREYVHQDVSNHGVTTVNPETQEETIQNYDTFHSRVVRSSDGRNMDVVFDREFTLGNRKFERVAIVDDHLARAQLVFFVEPRTGNIQVNRKYVLADLNQLRRLRRLFERFHYQQTSSERLATKFYEEPESRAQAGV